MQTSPSRPEHGSSSSAYRPGDPVTGLEATREAERWLADACGTRPVPPLLIVIGLADGRLLDVLESCAPHTRVLALEPDPATAAQCLSGGSPREWRDKARLTLLVGPEYHGAAEAWRLFPKQPDAFTLMLHPRLEPRDADVKQAADIAKRILVGVRGNAEARRRFAPQYLLNVVRNIPPLASGRDVRELRDVFRGAPAVIAAAGPSLDAALADLGGLGDRAVIIAADTALRPLLHAGITPRLVVAADPGKANARHFRELPACEDTWLVAESAIDPSVTASFADRTFWFQLSNHHPWPWLKECGLEVGSVEMWGSVLTAAFQTACLAGCDPIVFVGSDLAFTNDRPYCRGTTYEYDWATLTATGLPIRDIWSSWLRDRELVQVADVNGATTCSSPGFVSVRDWLVARIGRSGRHVINASGSGILAGIQIDQQALARVADALAPRSIPPLPPAREDTIARRAVAAALVPPLRKAMRELRSNEPTSPLREWLDFAGDRLDHADLAAALDATVQQLDRTSGEDQRSKTVRAPLIASGDAVNALVGALPEATDRFRAAVSNLASASDRASAKPLAVLAEAFHLLQCIHTRAHEQNDLVAPLQTADFDHTAVTARCWSHEPLRWAVTLFEGLLGAAACAPLPSAPPAPAFYARVVVPRDEATRPFNHSASHPHATQACALLAFEWLRVAAAQTGVSQSDAAVLLGWWRRFTETFAMGETPGQSPGATLVVAMTIGGQSHSLSLVIPATKPRLARLLTGAALTEGSGTLDLAQMTSPDMQVAIALKLTGVSESATSHAPAVMRAPRTILDTNAGRSIVAYSADDDVVCVRFHDARSLRVREGGIIAPHLSWPRTIVGELRFGDTGAVAWSNGLADWRQPTPAYVMYRQTASDEPIIEELPFRPGLGTWWGNRIYWCCQPDGQGAPTGLASWAPGEEPRLELNGPQFFDLQPFRDALLIHPRALDASGVHHRQRSPQGWIWRPGSAPEPLTLGPAGAATCCTTKRGWKASTYLESDLLHIDSPFGSASMTCYTPHRVAWLGQSLVVSTFEWDVLLFDDVMTSVAQRLMS